MSRDSDTFSRNVIGVHGEVGAAWLGRLSGIIADCERRWSIKVMPPFAPLSYAYVAPANLADGSEAVLKVRVPNGDFQLEMEALRLFDGKGTVRLLQADPGLGAMVLERLKTGTLLSSLTDDGRATTIAAQVMQQLLRSPPPGHCFPGVSEWAAGLGTLRERFGGATGPFPESLVDRAETLFSQLIATMGEPVLLHGDLHQYNILSAQRQPWLAIDPKGVVGEAEYEVGPFLRNCLLNRPHPERLLARRVDKLANDLGFERERILGWGLAQAVLSAWWSFEDSGRVGEEAMICAQVLADL
ncbi:MAG: hypothetical protein BZY88_05215 [SAR202 cluster bacterium Io17-Chloro-G9]|nr:MAG: hypothetical protein BZY88_05215 [SAR202 cluster bacterium Io17-Chloro-G9]